VVLIFIRAESVKIKLDIIKERLKNNVIEFRITLKI
jgi:hypothetical protein